MSFLSQLVMLVGLACLSAAALYATLNCAAQLAWRWPRNVRESGHSPPITLLKPLCGAEPGLYQDLKSFCLQDYPEYQIIFGIRDEIDPASAVAKRLAAEFPSVPIRVVINPQLHGSNLKVSNLLNMLPHAEHELLVMSDSDAFVRPDYLKSVTPPLSDPRVGLVTCIYHGAPTPGIWSRLGAMYINDWYVPSILLAWLFGHQGYVSGQTICIRQSTLHALGGLATLADHLADDNRLGTMVRKLGLKIHLSQYVVAGEHHETTLDCMARHEIRWMKTLRVLRPGSFRWLFLTFTLPLTAAGAGLVLAAGPSSMMLTALKAIVAMTLTSRLVMHFAHRLSAHRHMLADVWLLPVRDVLLCWVWSRCFFTSRVTWRGKDFNIDSDGVMHRVS